MEVLTIKLKQTKPTIMKTIVNSLAIFFMLTTAFSSFSQGTTPDTTDKIYLSQNAALDNVFEVLPLTPSRRGAFFSHLWWSGDNSFSFAAKPIHNHRTPRSTGNSTVFKMTDIVTESYGTGGPPPLTYTFTGLSTGGAFKEILTGDTIIHVQTYRNAVIKDTMYLIITYANPISDLLSGSLKIDVGPHAEVSTQTLERNKHFRPNGETWDSISQTISFTDMAPSGERSILIPVKINSTDEKNLNMRVDYEFGANGNPGNVIGKNYFPISATVAHSHDPNLMIEHSDVNTQCDYRGGKIHYTVMFQNEGTGPTEYVRVVCHFDDKVDLNTIDSIKVPAFYSSGCGEDNNIKMRYVNCRRAIWSIDHSQRTLTIEMDHLILESIMDPNLPFIDMTRDQIEFDILVKDNYLFGPPVLSYSEIFFNTNKAIVTNLAKTGCVAPVPLDKGGGFQCEESSFVCKYKWWFLGGILALILLLLILLARKKKKRNETIEEKK